MIKYKNIPDYFVFNAKIILIKVKLIDFMRT